MSYEKFHPLIYWWIAFYNDGQCLPQFDVETGKENPFSSIEQDKLEKFGLFPFNAQLTIKANISAGFVVARELELPFFIQKLQKGQRLIYVRRNFIHLFSFQHCNKCEYEWQWMPNRQDREKTEIGLLIHPNQVIQIWNGKTYPCAQCPKCQSYNAVVCPDCKDTLINELKRAEKNDEHYFRCPKCGKEFARHIILLENTIRQLVYLLGYQTTIDGQNKKVIMFINEDGTFELSDDYNYR
jgi:predicted RNA-binding Zn-ribbon protein involved in translation (DUF1610 family)